MAFTGRDQQHAPCEHVISAPNTQQLGGGGVQVSAFAGLRNQVRHWVTRRLESRGDQHHQHIGFQAGCGCQIQGLEFKVHNGVFQSFGCYSIPFFA
jgi:hypothetical protein